MIKRLFKKSPPREPVTHDLTPRTWGNDYTFTPEPGGLTARMVGWRTPLPRRGDYLILQDTSKVLGYGRKSKLSIRDEPLYGTTRYRVVKIEYALDPPDMWYADVHFDPREPDD